MRVIHVITRLIVGGAQENTIASVKGLASRPGLRVSLISGPTFGPEGSLESEFAATPNLLTIIPELVRPIHPWKDSRAYFKLKGLFRDQHPDVVHTHSGKAGLLGRLAARHAGVDHIIHTIHGPSFGAFQGPLANALFTAAERLAARYTTRFVVVAQAMATQYLAAGIGSSTQYCRIFSGFNLAPYLSILPDAALRLKLGLDEQDVVVGKIARLFKLKGHDDLFAVAPALIRRNPRIKFLLVGDGHWRKRFMHLAHRQGLGQHVLFAGLVPPSEMPRYVGLMNIVVHLSRREGLPRALPQALAAGRPIIAYDCDGAREVCLNEETGCLLQPGDLAGLQDRILRLAADASLRKRLGKYGQVLVREWFEESKMVDALQALYLELLPHPRATARST